MRAPARSLTAFPPVLMRRFSSALLAASLLAPAIASAAFVQPSDVLRAVQADASAHAFSVEVHGDAAGAYMSMWGKGQYEGSTLATAKSTGKVTVDFAQPSQGVTMRIKLQYVLTDGVFYALLDDVNVAGETPYAAMAGSVRGKRWIRFEGMRELEQEAAMMGSAYGADAVDSTMSELMDAMFSMTSTGNTYRLALRPDAFDGLLRMIAMQGMGSDGMDRETLRALMREMRADPSMATLRGILSNLDLEYSIQMNAAGRLLHSLIKGAVNVEGINVRFSGESTAMAAPVRADAPADSITPEAFSDMLDVFDSGFLPGATLDLPTMGGFDSEGAWGQEWDQEWNNNDDLTSDWSWIEDDAASEPCAPTDALSVSALRKGSLCSNPARRHNNR